MANDTETSGNIPAYDEKWGILPSVKKGMLDYPEHSAPLVWKQVAEAIDLADRTGHQKRVAKVKFSTRVCTLGDMRMIAKVLTTKCFNVRITKTESYSILPNETMPHLPQEAMFKLYLEWKV